MNLVIKNTNLVVSDCYPYRFNNGKLVLRFTVDKAEIGHDQLYDLIKDNTEDILCQREDGSVDVYSGFKYTLTILTKEDTYEVEVECVSEVERKVGELQRVIADLSAETTTSELALAELYEMMLG